MLGAAALSDVGEFEITVDNAVEPGPNQSGHVAFLSAGQRAVTLELAKLDNTDDLNAAIRSGTALSFAASFVHPAGHELTIGLPHLHVERSDEDGDPARVATSRSILPAATDESGSDLTYEVNLSEAPTTTTAAP
jgi:hypothetical protein